MVLCETSQYWETGYHGSRSIQETRPWYASETPEATWNRKELFPDAEPSLCNVVLLTQELVNQCSIDASGRRCLQFHDWRRTRLIPRELSRGSRNLYGSNFFANRLPLAPGAATPMAEIRVRKSSLRAVVRWVCPLSSQAAIIFSQYSLFSLVRLLFLRPRISRRTEGWGTWIHGALTKKSLTKRLYHGHTSGMKTAISLPDALYVDAEKTAKSMGIPRSQLFAIALEEFINHHKKERITDQLNDVYKNMEEGNPSSMNEVNLISMRELTKNDTW